MPPPSFDIAIIGGGPAGSATALSLRQHAPALSVVLIESTRYEAFRIGETLLPPARPMLEHLGCWQAFASQSHREVYGTTAIWGAALPLDNDFIYMPAGTGWHLNRAAFDEMLAKQAEMRGVTLLLETRLRHAENATPEEPGGPAWTLTLSPEDILSARFVVDATGAAAFARRQGSRFVDADQLVAFARVFQGGPGDPRTMVEAFEAGWWYTAGLPDGGRIAACMTDMDVARRMNLRNSDEWSRRLASAPNIAGTLDGSQACSPVAIHSTQSRRLEPVLGDGWLAVGDSASRFDPLSSQGIVKALRSGIFASYAIGDLLTKDDDASVARYERYIREEFSSYQVTRTKYYREEQRWPTSEFWRRRHVVDRIRNHEF